jgi:hypothetical protein
MGPRSPSKGSPATSRDGRPAAAAAAAAAEGGTDLMGPREAMAAMEAEVPLVRCASVPNSRPRPPTARHKAAWDDGGVIDVAMAHAHVQEHEYEHAHVQEQDQDQDQDQEQEQDQDQEHEDGDVNHARQDGGMGMGMTASMAAGL